MGLLDAIRGRRKLKAPAPDRLFALTTAHIKLELELGVRSRGSAGLVFQALETADFQTLLTDAEELVRATGEETATQVSSLDDEFGYRWLVVRDPEVEDLVVSVNALGGAIQAGGYGDRLLASVFAFEDSKSRPVYWIYNYKRGTFYPFVPAGGDKQRDNARELQLKAQVGSELPVEPELERWFPLWAIPI